MAEYKGGSGRFPEILVLRVAVRCFRKRFSRSEKGGARRNAREYVQKARGGKHGHGTPQFEARGGAGPPASAWAGMNARCVEYGKSMVYKPGCAPYN